MLLGGDRLLDPLNVSVAILMRCKNEMPVVKRVLEQLSQQQGVQYSLYVIDSGSTDGSLDWLQKSNAQLTKIAPSSYQPGAVLNSFVKKCREEIIVFLNADAVPSETTWLYKMVSFLQKSDYAAIFCRQVPRVDAFFVVQKEYEWTFNLEYVKRHPTFFSHVASACRREIAATYPYYEKGYSEDCEWAERITKRGYKIGYLLDTAVEHSHNYTFRQLYQRKYIEGEADVYSNKRRDALLRVIARYSKKIGRFILSCWREGRLREVPHGIVWFAVSAVGYYIGQIQAVRKSS